MPCGRGNHGRRLLLFFMNRNSVIFLQDWHVLVDSLTENNRLVFWDMFAKYSFGVSQNCDNEQVKPVWNFIKSQLDRMNEDWLKRAKINKNNGSKGGRPKAKETENNPTEPKQTLNKNKNKNNNINNNINIDLPFFSLEFLEVWKKLIQQPKWKKKSPDALQGCADLLKNLSEQEAIQTMQDTINGGWQGLFPKTNKTTDKISELQKFINT